MVIDRESLPEDYKPSVIRGPEPEPLTLLSTGCTAGGVSVDADSATDRCEVSAAGVPDVTDGLQPYYLDFSMGEGASELRNNHIPLDPALDGVVLLSKRSAKETISVGEFAPYLIRVENLSPFELNNVLISDLVPAGFELVKESIRLLRAGDDGQLETEDDDISSGCERESANRVREF